MNYVSILPIAAGAAILYFIGKAQTGKNLKIYLTGVKFSGGGLIPNIFLNFRVLNVTSNSVSIDSLVGDVTINGKFFASVSNTERFTIPANSDTYYSVKLTPSALSAISIVYNLIKNKQRVNVEFNGTVNSTGALIPINQKASIG
jgi:LEA14-like dessication related protein